MIRSVQSLRFVFIMLVVMSHILKKPFDFGGECGVSFFFVLSGFILSYAYGERILEGQFRLGAFLKRQLAKIYPLHLLTFFIMIVLDIRLGQFYHWTKLLANMLLLQSWVPADSFYFVANGSSWFLSDLMFFYLIFPFLYKLITRARLLCLAICAATVLTLYVLLATSIPQDMVNPLLYISPVTRSIEFALGILLHRYYKSRRGQRESGWLCNCSITAATIVELAMVALVAGSFFVYECSSPGFRCASMFWLITPLVIYTFVIADKGRGLITQLLHHPAMMWLGSISLEIYLTHYVTMRILYSIMLSCGYGEEYRFMPLVILATIMVIVLVSYITKRTFVDRIYTTLLKKSR